MKTIQKQICLIDKQIEKLEKQKSKLIKSEKSPIEKFKLWWESNKDEKPDCYVPGDYNGFPKLREYLDEKENWDDWKPYDRHMVVELSDILCEEFNYAIYDVKPEYGEEWKNEKIKEYDKKYFQTIALEIMKGKLKSFKYDW